MSHSFVSVTLPQTAFSDFSVAWKSYANQSRWRITPESQEASFNPFMDFTTDSSVWELTQAMRGWDMDVYRCKNTQKSPWIEQHLTAWHQWEGQCTSVTSALTLGLCRMSDVSPEHPIRNKHRCSEFHFRLEHLVDPFSPLWSLFLCPLLPSGQG